MSKSKIVNSTYKSIAKNYLASGFGLGITFLNQIAMVPLFILFWGVEQYADWILITAFSSFFTMTDVGLNSVTQNEFVIKYHRQEYDICSKLLLNMFLLIAAVGFAIVCMAVIFSCFFGFDRLLNVSVFSGFQTSYVFVALLLQVFMKMYGGVYNGIYRAVSQTARCIMIENIVRFCEILILFVGIWLKLPIILIISVYVIPVMGSIVFRHFDSRKWFRPRFSTRHFDFPLLKSLLKPAFAFLALPVGNAISNQGMIFVVHAVLGPVLLVAFTTTRTLVNFLRAVMGMLAASIWPELSAAYGKHDMKTMSTIYHRSFIITIASCLLCILFLAVFGKPIYLAWTHYEVLFNAPFFYGMLVILLLLCLWSIASVVLSAVNKHINFSMVFLLVVVFETAITYVCLRIYPDLFIIPLALLIPEVLLLVYVLKKTNELLNNNFSTFFHQLGIESVFLMKRLVHIPLKKNK